MKIKRSWTLCLLILFLSVPSWAGQTRIPDYETARRRVFYKELYPHGGWTLYCGVRWKTKEGLNIEHVYPASWMGKHLKCGTRKKCRKTSRDFNYMEADLHNLYPALGPVNKARSNYKFAILPMAPKPFKTCPFKLDKKKRLAEPRRRARGNIARAVSYMSKEYGLPIPESLKGLLRSWHREDPVSPHERRRNDAIERLQGTRNPFIDRPQEVSKLLWQE